ncbi:GGDEF domain-containing protein [Acidiferrimicrobium sp. IK]|uniref:GGDEF domain-containing protein n=1 Tax=Acidiferrimicrobium sp. IK TaxID=2871700 RepID=UPI0021CB8138|nr:GGDEF domain-containing protein [Acidiferrimicrobium sp. IK]MCU4186575.1 GGDEF domain-containing protein [Acidiferrimicrobium sp. IK]
MTSGLASRADRGRALRRVTRKGQAQARHPSARPVPQRLTSDLTIVQHDRMSAYIVAVVVAAVSFLALDTGFSLGQPLFGRSPYEFALLAGCLVLAQLQMSFRRVAGQRDIQVSPDGTFMLALLLCATPLAAVVASAVIFGGGDVVRGYARHKAVVNTGQLVVSLSLASVVLHLAGLGLGGGRPLSFWWLAAFAVAASVSAASNFLLTAVAVSITAHTSALRVFKEIAGGQLHHETLLASLAPIIVAAGDRSLWLIGLMPVATWAVGRSSSLAHAQGHDATHDQLTKLPNRRYCDNQLTSAVEAHERVAVLVLDLDGFKAINDRYGHQAGDQVLIEVAARLRSACRASDTVARTGGDEFTLLATPNATVEMAEHLARRCLEALGGLAVGNLRVGASIGIAVTPDHARSTTALLRCADKAMYEAKRDRRGIVVYRSPTRV